MKKIKLNLGSGEKLLEGYINCDVLEHIKADKHFDLNSFPYPFKNNYADEIFMDNVLEHLIDVVGVMKELHRILKADGVLRIIVPYGKSDWALQDPTHTHYFTEKTMNYFDSSFDYNYYSEVRFKVEQAKLFNGPFSGPMTFVSKLRSLVPFKSVLKYYFYNIYDGIYFEMRAIK